MKETLIDIVEKIDSSSDVRRRNAVHAVARVHTEMNGEDTTFWFTPDSRNLHEYAGKELRGLGRFVPKNSFVAVKMQSNDIGSSFEYEQMNSYKRMQKYKVVLENRTNFQDCSISIAGDTTLYQFRNIHEFLDALRENERKIAEVKAETERQQQRIEALKEQDGTAHERGVLTKSVNKLKHTYRILTQQQEDLQNITIYIRKQGEIRYTPIVDPVQTRIKSQNLFDGKTIIINGGPGTGKTTTMIHRLGYLTDTYAIEEDEKLQANNYKLNHQQRQQLLDAIKSDRDWMFFSPSQLLKDYLAQAMKNEGLTNTSSKVWNWKDYCRMVLQANYRLLESKTKAPFRISYDTETLFYQRSGIIEELTNFFTQQLRCIRLDLPEFKSDGKVYQWTAIALGIQKRFEESENYDIARFIGMFNTLEQVYGDDCRRLLRDNQTLIRDITEEICSLLDDNEDAKYDIEDILDFSMGDDADDNDVSIEDEPNNLYSPIREWLKQYCYCQVSNDSKQKKIHLEMNKVLLPLLDNMDEGKIRKIGELVLFEQFAKYTNGVGQVMLGGFPGLYKRFRSYVIKEKIDGYNLPLLNELKHRHGGRELHHQEQALIIGFINNIVKLIKASGNKNVKHTFVDAYEELARPIIGVDEATDFCECDIYAMQSLLSPEFNSMTLCGDMMQRLTDYGITSWDDLKGLVSNPTVVEMKTSYRQSAKLLDVARQLYRDTIGTTPNYKAYMNSSRVPKPLVCVSEDEFTKVRWIEKRIEEVYRAYGQQLPAIAIFVNDKGYIPGFVERLLETDFISSNGIEVIDGLNSSSASTGNHIRVYPIDIVKGMEFDVVFFHNIDNAYVDTEILKRYIYVGVSRAAFFLGITLSEWKEELCKYFETDKDWFKI